MHKIMEVLPCSIKLQMQDIDINKLTEIRVRNNQNLCFRFGQKEIVKEYKVVSQDITDILKKVSLNSIYSIQSEINQGYITAPGGNRIGIVGEAVIDNGEIKNVKNISSMNIRICHEIYGASDIIFSQIYNEGQVKNSLIVSAPGYGKTTILRDIIRKISNSGKNVGLVDERNEIAAVFRGKATLDVGTRTDIITNVPKEYGINLLTRSMGIEVIATDEIGNEQDVSAIVKAMQSGVKVIATAHGSSNEKLPHNLLMLIQQGYFDNIIYLSKEIGKIDKIICKKEEMINVC